MDRRALHFNAFTANIAISDILLKTRFFGEIFASDR